MRVLVVGSLVLVVAACGGGGGAAATATPASATPAPATQVPVTTSAPGELPAAEELCGLLTADDWGQFGYVTAATPEMNTDGPGTAYCVYAGTSGATGGLEFDAFVHEDEAQAEGTLETITGEGPEMSPVELEGADAALISTEGDYAYIAVRIGRFTFTIALPTGDEAEDQLTTLANRVIDQSAFYR